MTLDLDSSLAPLCAELSWAARQIKFGGLDPDGPLVPSSVDAPGSSGNIVATVDYEERGASGPWVPLPQQYPALAGRALLVTRSGSDYRHYVETPEAYRRNYGILRVDARGLAYQVVWGLSDGGSPTSELPAQLAVVEARVAAGEPRVVSIHDHASAPLRLARLIRDGVLRKGMVERVNGEDAPWLAGGVGYVEGYLPNGSLALADATARELRGGASVLVWFMHGIDVVASTASLALARREHFMHATLELLGHYHDRPFGLPQLNDAQLREARAVAERRGLR